jgi:hypothetical protein
MSVHSPTPTSKAPSPEAMRCRHIIPGGIGIHPLDARGTGPGQSGEGNDLMEKRVQVCGMLGEAA